MSTSDWLRTGIGATTADSITIRGRDLAGYGRTPPSFAWPGFA